MESAIDQRAIPRHTQEGHRAPFSGEYWDNHRNGLYRCVCCGTPSFASDAKFESGTGWPPFSQPVVQVNVRADDDASLWMAAARGRCRASSECAVCDAHLGHVFADGPKPTGLRYCMNSAALKFDPAD